MIQHQKFVLKSFQTESFDVLLVQCQVLVISAENHLPYMRPPLSKDIWFTDDDEVIAKHSFKQWNGKEKRFLFDIFDFNEI